MMVGAHVGTTTSLDRQVPEFRGLKSLAEQVSELLELRLLPFGPVEDEPWERIAEWIAPATELDPVRWVGSLLEVQDDPERVERFPWLAKL